MADIDNTLKNIAREAEERHAKERAQKLGLDYINLVSYPFAPNVLALIPKEKALQYRLVAYLKVENLVKVATDNPPNVAAEELLENLKKQAQFDFRLSFCSRTSLDFALSRYDTLLPETRETKVEVTKESQDSFEKEISSIKALRDKITTVSTTELLDVVFAGAMRLDASDIHIEPASQQMRIRYRIDGVLQNVADLPMEAFHNLLSRVKYLAQLKLDITHSQNGRFSVKVIGQDVDVRVATMPTSYGEAFTLRLLPKNKQFLTLEKLGFSEEGLAAIHEAISQPQGMILNTGPTGSGKTTTLYAILQKLNVSGTKIITLEDPIEYRISGIEQVQIDVDKDAVSGKAKTSFLDALKASLRQDPNTLMIGEIRDKETADIALQAAMTGHLVLSTLHTNNAPSSFARLAEMGVEPYLMSGTINLIIAQRLVRKIHETCEGKGCDECHGTGFKGRIAILEYLVPGPEIEKLIQEKSPLREFEEIAKKLGMKTMHEDGLEKVKQGITTKEEVERVTKE